MIEHVKNLPVLFGSTVFTGLLVIMPHFCQMIHIQYQWMIKKLLGMYDTAETRLEITVVVT